VVEHPVAQQSRRHKIRDTRGKIKLNQALHCERQPRSTCSSRSDSVTSCLLETRTAIKAHAVIFLASGFAYVVSHAACL
jgi:hypothetical protein